MRQRVAFLRTLLAGRPLLCLDEPFGALDALTRDADAALARRARSQREPRTVLLVTHDVEEAVLLADRIVLLSPRPGRVVATLDVPLPRPRHRTDPEVVALRERALEALGRVTVSARSIVLVGLAGWEAIVRLGRRRRADPPRADPGARGAVDRPRACWRPTSR